MAEALVWCISAVRIFLCLAPEIRMTREGVEGKHSEIGSTEPKEFHLFVPCMTGTCGFTELSPKSFCGFRAARILSEASLDTSLEAREEAGRMPCQAYTLLARTLHFSAARTQSSARLL